MTDQYTHLNLIFLITGLQHKPSYEHVQTLRKAQTDEEKQDVEIFFEQLIPSVLGQKLWRKAKSSLLISECITNSQEATALWIFKNYEDKWKGPSSATQQAKFTGSTRGNKMYNGWSHEGILEYNEISKLIKEDRLDGELYEWEFRDKQIIKLEEVAARRSGKRDQRDEINKRIHMTVHCCDDLSDSGGSDHDTHFSQHSLTSTNYSLPSSNEYPRIVTAGMPEGQTVVAL